MVNRNDFWIAGCKIANHNLGASDVVGLRRFREHFGISPEVCLIAWLILAGKHLHPPGAIPLHMLIAILFLKRYQTESIDRTITGLDEKTIRKWRWIYVDLLAKHLDVVSNLPDIALKLNK
jgi:hypothetical protein